MAYLVYLPHFQLMDFSLLSLVKEAQGRIPHAAERLGPWATIAEPEHLEPVLHSGRGRDSGRPAHRDEEWPPLAATGEGPCTETKTQDSHK